jgi:hypothetical protein
VSDFEFVFGGFTIVVALAVARLLEGLRDTFDPNRRYWIHYVWVVNRLLFVLASFWVFLEARDLADFNFFLFVMMIIPPAVLFLQANALVTSQPGAIENWKEHFWSVRKWFFGSNVILMLGTSVLSSQEAYPESELLLSRYVPLPSAIGFLLSIVGYSSSSERVHGVLATVAIITVLLGWGARFTVLA